MNLHIDHITLLGIATSAIGLFLGVFYICANKFKNDGYLFLYLLLLVLSYEVFYKMLIHSRLIYQYVVLFRPGRFFNQLVYPLFLFFIWSITKDKFKLKTGHWMLLAVFAGYTILLIVGGTQYSPEGKKHLLDLFYSDTRPGPFNYWGNWRTLLEGTIIPIVFLGIIGYDFFRFRRKTTGLPRSRLVHILTGIIVSYFIFYQLANPIYRWGYQITGYSMIEWPVDIGFLSIIDLAFAVIALSVNSGSTFFPPARYQSSALSTESYKQIIQSARKLLEEEEGVTYEQWTLTEMSKRLGINSRYLSQAINHHLQISFVDFINEYKVNEAKKQLLDERNHVLTIEAIGHLAGFKSKSAFFRAFKKATGFTPNQYVKSKKSSRL